MLRLEALIQETIIQAYCFGLQWVASDRSLRKVCLTIQGIHKRRFIETWSHPRVQQCLLILCWLFPSHLQPRLSESFSRMSRNEHVYDLEKFSPERVLSKALLPNRHSQRPLDLVEGQIHHHDYSRPTPQSMPGRNLAESSLYIIILSMFGVSKAIGDDGQEIGPKIEMLASSR